MDTYPPSMRVSPTAQVSAGPRRRQWCLAVGLGLCWPWAAWSAGDALSTLERFLSDTREGRAAFTQTVTSASAGATARPRISRGTFEFQRPDRFRFVYQQPFQQEIVGDGQTLWLYDPDLQQVTARPQREVMGDTPASILSGAGDFKALSAAFVLSNAPDAQGMQWVKAVPRDDRSGTGTVLFGFRAGELAVLDMRDAFGQHSVITFSSLERRPAFRTGYFQFQPPAGVQVLNSSAGR